jgi:uncharacterized protein (UPF0332 family)
MREEYIKYRIVRAKETFSDAVFLFEKNSWNSCINRLYYSAFYAAIALLLFHKIEVKSHNGVKRKLGELVKSNILSKNLVKHFGVLSDLRHKGDYDDLFDFNQELTENLIEPTRLFINSIEKICLMKN